MTKIRTIISDGFQWHVLSKDEAIEAYNRGEEVFRLYDDGGEGQVLSLEEFDEDDHDIYGVEKGYTKLPDDIDEDLYYDMNLYYYEEEV